VIGPPFRMLVAFTEADERRRTLMRTLLQQELIQGGVLTTQNLFLPSAAHDDEALEITRRAFEHALGVLAEALEDDRFVSRLEIPPLPG
jgi:glutamate-1-semialdehyde aminotransferase